MVLIGYGLFFIERGPRHQSAKFFFLPSRIVSKMGKCWKHCQFPLLPVEASLKSRRVRTGLLSSDVAFLQEKVQLIHSKSHSNNEETNGNN
jgi:hypothetical protein